MNTQLKLFENTGGYFLLKFFEIVILRNHASFPFQKLGLGNKLQFTIKDKETTFLQFSTLQNLVVISGCKGLKRRWNLWDITPTSLRLIFLTQLPTPKYTAHYWRRDLSREYFHYVISCPNQPTGSLLLSRSDSTWHWIHLTIWPKSSILISLTPCSEISTLFHWDQTHLSLTSCWSPSTCLLLLPHSTWNVWNVLLLKTLCLYRQYIFFIQVLLSQEALLLNIPTLTYWTQTYESKH